MTKPFETITLPLLQQVTGGARTAAAIGSSQGFAQQTQSVQPNAPGSGGSASRMTSGGGR